MGKITTYVGLDVHKKSIVAAMAMAGEGEARLLGSVAHEPEAVARLMRRLGSPKGVLVCYEAGPCGYALQRQVESLGITCVVVAPSLIPRKPGDRVKTDRRDALKLARLLRAGELTPVWAPDPAQEALRDLTRAREAAKGDVLRARHRIAKMLLRLGVRQPPEIKACWTQKHEKWLAGLTFNTMEQTVVWECLLEALGQAMERLRRLTEALVQGAARSKHARLVAGLQCLRGVGLVTAATWVAELGDVAGRFPLARPLMGYAGLGVKEWSSGQRERRGAITKAGNSHVRFAAVEAAWHYRHRPQESRALRKRREGQPEAVVAIARKAEDRLHQRLRRLVRKGKADTCAVTAAARELLGFVWAIAWELASSEQPERAAA